VGIASAKRATGRLPAAWSAGMKLRHLRRWLRPRTGRAPGRRVRQSTAPPREAAHQMLRRERIAHAAVGHSYGANVAGSGSTDDVTVTSARRRAKRQRARAHIRGACAPDRGCRQRKRSVLVGAASWNNTSSLHLAVGGRSRTITAACDPRIRKRREDRLRHCARLLLCSAAAGRATRRASRTALA